MARVFITGSSDGLGLMAARLLIEQGHEVVLHGRDEGRSRDALAAAAGAGGVVSEDLSTIAGIRRVADEANKLGRFDAVIHNAGIGSREARVEVEVRSSSKDRSERARRSFWARCTCLVARAIVVLSGRLCRVEPTAFWRLQAFTVSASL